MENITDGSQQNNNLLMTQEEVLKLYDFDCKSLTDMISKMEGSLSKDYIRGFKFAIELFANRKKIGF